MWLSVYSAVLCRVDYVAECLLELVMDDSKNGAALTMSKAKGKTYVSVPDATAILE